MPASDGEVTSKVEAAMARVRASVSAAAGDAAPAPSRSAAGETRTFPEDVYRCLHQARTIGGGITVDHALGWRTPIIGQVWLVVRRRIHQEIRIYVDSLTTQQSNLNVHLIRALSHLVETLDSLGLRAMKRQQSDHAEALIALQEEVRFLRQQVETLHARIDGVTAPRPNPNGGAAAPN